MKKKKTHKKSSREASTKRTASARRASSKRSGARPKKTQARRPRGLSHQARRFLRREIRTLMCAGYEQKRAIAAAYAMARAQGYKVPPAPPKHEKNPLLLVTELVGLGNPDGFVKKLNLGQVVCWKDMPESVKQNPEARSAAVRAARLQRIPLDQLKGEVCRGPKGVAPHTITSGELVSFAYKAALESSHAHDEEGRRIIWHHASGDHGRGKKRTKPCLVATDPRTNLPLFLARRGSKPGLSSRRGHVG